MPRTVLHFSSPVPGNQCSAGECATRPNGGTLASARRRAPHAPSPGRLRPGHRGPARWEPARWEPAQWSQPSGSQPSGSQPVAGQPGAGQPGGSQPGESQSGAGQPGGSDQGGTVPGGWGQRRAAAHRGPPGSQHHLPAGRAVAGRLRRPDHDPRLSRTRTQAGSWLSPTPGGIAGVQGARWEPGPAGGRGWRRGWRGPAGGRRIRPRPPVRLTVIVEGQPAAPSGCAFDGQLCEFGARAAS